MKQLTVSAWRLIFSAVAEPRISGKPAKSREIHNNVRNTAKFVRNLIKYLSIQHIWKLSRLLGLFNFRKLANLPWNFITTMREQCLKITSGSRGDVFVVRTSKPVENLWKNGLFLIALQFRYTFYRLQAKRLRDRKIGRWPSVTLRATCRAPTRIWLAVIDFQKSIWVR